MLSGVMYFLLFVREKGYLRIDGEDEPIDIQNNDNFIIKKSKTGICIY